VKPLRQIVDDFTEPIITEALAKREIRLAKNVDLKDNEAENLLTHLVNSTQGQSCFLHTGSQSTLNSNAIKDQTILKDEVNTDTCVVPIFSDKTSARQSFRGRTRYYHSPPHLLHIYAHRTP